MWLHRVEKVSQLLMSQLAMAAITKFVKNQKGNTAHILKCIDR